MDVIEVTYEGVTYKMHRSAIINEGFARDRSVEEAAYILAANLEVPTIEADGTVDISKKTNFNDSYHDMVADLLDENDEG